MSLHDVIPIVCDGREDAEGRALFLISALHFCHAELRDAKVYFVDTDGESVRIAASALRWETGLDVVCLSLAQSSQVLAGARLFCSVVMRQRTFPRLEEAIASRVPVLIARQFPDREMMDSGDIRMLRAAHDPSILAERLVEMARRN